MAKRSRPDPAVLERVWRIAARLSEEKDPRRLVPLILDEAIALVEAQRGFAIVMRDGAFEVAGARNMDLEDVARPDFALSRSIARRVAASGRAELIDDATSAETTRGITSVKALDLRSILCVPLRAHGATLGVVYVDHRHMRSRFDATSLATLEAFAVPAAVALEAAWSRDELARRIVTIEALRRDLAARYRESARELDRLRADAARRMLAPGAAADLGGIVARSPGMRRALELVRKAAPTDANVLIVGESGTGKELVARALHALSLRRSGPFVAESCAALSDPLLESELFGHERGAFTGAVEARAGIFEAARGGTLFLDEVGDTTPALQARLLRVLEERAVRRLGASEAVPLDVRIVAATNRDLEALVASGAFRADLLYRLHVVRVELPPLRERGEDLPALIEALLAAHGARSEDLEPEARDLLLAHSWPGNVRELDNELRRLVVLAQGGPLRASLLSPHLLGVAEPPPRGPEAAPRVRPLALLEKEMVERALEEARGNKTLAARLLGITKTALYRRLERHGLDAEE